MIRVPPEEWKPPSASYFVCTTPRSGSTYVCGVLASTNALGRPDEYLNDPAPWPSVVRRIRSSATPNGVMGLKLFPVMMHRIQAHIDLRHWFPGARHVLLTREDLLGQAISMVLAQQTNSWTSEEPGTGVAEYDGARIRQALKDCVAERASWHLYFARTGIVPLEITYEGFVADPQGVARAVARYVGVDDPGPVELGAVPLQPQRTAVNEEWRARFIAEFGDPSRFELPLGTRVFAAPRNVKNFLRFLRGRFYVID